MREKNHPNKLSIVRIFVQMQGDTRERKQFEIQNKKHKK